MNDALTLPFPLRLAPAGESRLSRLGASEVAAVLGMSRFKTPLEVWESKTGRTGASPDTAVTRRGRYLEGGLLRWLADEVGAVEHVVGSAYTEPYVVGDAPHIGAHPDGYLKVKEWGCAEVKTARDDREYGEEGDEVPDGYWVQTQIQLYCTGLTACHFGVYLPFREEFRSFWIERDEAAIAAMLERCEAWWTRHIQGDTPPDATDASEVSRQLAYRYPRESGAMRAATADEAADVLALAQLKRDIKALDLQADAVGNRIRMAIGDDTGLLLAEGSVTWKVQETASYVVKARTNRVLRTSLRGV